MSLTPPIRPPATRASAPTWPPAPDPSESNLAHALLYQSLGWWVFYGRDDLDVAEFRHGALRKFKAEGMSIADASRKAADKAERARKHTPVPWRERRALGGAGRPTAAEVTAMFEDRPLRPVVVLTGAVAGGEEQLAGIDIDPTRGGVATPWVGPEVTLLAKTPSGGLHAYHLASAAEQVASSEGKDDPHGGSRHYGIADGVDVRGAGGLLVAPSGEEATPGRRWLRWGVPSPAPLEDMRRRLSERTGWSVEARQVERGPMLSSPSTALMAVASGGVDGVEDDDVVPTVAPALRAFSSAMLQPAPDGVRNMRAKLIVGVLAKPGQLPADARAAALSLLRDWAEQRQLDEDVTSALEAGWEAQLGAARRYGAFAHEMLRAWDETRCAPAWGPEKIEEVARSLWRTASAREQAREAEEAQRVQASSATAGPGTSTSGAGSASAGTSSPRGGVFEAPCDDDAGSDVVPEGEALAAFLPTLASLYGEAELDRDLMRELLPSAVLPCWQKINAAGEVVPDLTPCGHGLGPAIDEVTGGGLRPGYVAVVGAESAKIGKTALLDQWIDGMTLRSVETVRALLRGEKTDTPIVVRYDLSEMSADALTHRQLGRWLGVDSTVFRRGKERAHLAPGLRRLAQATGRDAHVLAAQAHAAARSVLSEGMLAEARALRVIVHPRALQGTDDHEGPGRPKDHRRGVLLLRALAEGIRADRAARALAWGVPESQVWPLVFVDPIQRFQREGDGDTVGALDELVEELRALADENGWIVLATSDTNKDSAKGGATREKNLTPFQLAATVFRGSYKLMHLPDLALVLRVAHSDDPTQPATAELVAALNRWGAPRSEPHVFDFTPETGRYVPRVPVDAPEPDGQQVPLDEADPEPEPAPIPRARAPRLPRPADEPSPPLPRLSADATLLLARLKAWRTSTAGGASVPPYVVATDATLQAIVAAVPRTTADLLRVSGLKADKVTKYGAGILAVVVEVAALEGVDA